VQAAAPPVNERGRHLLEDSPISSRAGDVAALTSRARTRAARRRSRRAHPGPQQYLLAFGTPTIRASHNAPSAHVRCSWSDPAMTSGAAARSPVIRIAASPSSAASYGNRNRGTPRPSSAVDGWHRVHTPANHTADCHIAKPKADARQLASRGAGPSMRCSHALTRSRDHLSFTRAHGDSAPLLMLLARGGRVCLRDNSQRNAYL